MNNPKDLDLVVDRWVSTLNKFLFEYLTRILMLGVLYQVSLAVSNTALRVVAALMGVFLVVNIAFDILKLFDRAYMEVIGARLPIYIRFLILGLIGMLLLVLLNNFVGPVMQEFFDYYRVAGMGER